MFVIFFFFLAFVLQIYLERNPRKVITSVKTTNPFGLFFFLK